MKITLLEWAKPFPYRQLNEILEKEDIKTLFNNNLFFNNSGFQEINNKLADFFYDKYGERYPHIQDKELLLSHINQIKETYLATFYNNIYIHLKGKSGASDYITRVKGGNQIVYNKRGGTSSTPYNITYLGQGGVGDNLLDKYMSETIQSFVNGDDIKRASDLIQSKFSGEIVNFIDSFYSLFLQINIDEYIEKQLHYIMDVYKELYNHIIDEYDEVMKIINKWKEQ